MIHNIVIAHTRQWSDHLEQMRLRAIEKMGTDSITKWAVKSFMTDFIIFSKIKLKIAQRIVCVFSISLQSTNKYS